jgi:hypothetical protein
MLALVLGTVIAALLVIVRSPRVEPRARKLLRR